MPRQAHEPTIINMIYGRVIALADPEGLMPRDR